MKNVIFKITLCLLFGAGNAQGQALKYSGTPYPFPVVPNTEAWKQLASHEEMLRATEVPDSTLRGMSTNDLLATAMTYPLKWDALAFDNMIVGVKTVAARSAIFQELLRRPDASEKTLSLYQALSPDAPQADWAAEASGLYSLTFLFVESLLAQPQMIAALSADQSTALLKQVGDNHAKMQLRPDLYGGMNHAIPAFLAGKILIQKGRGTDLLAQAEVSDFLRGRFAQPSETAVSSIFSATAHFILTNKK